MACPDEQQAAVANDRKRALSSASSTSASVKRVKRLCEELVNVPCASKGEYHYYKNNEEFKVAQSRCVQLLEGMLQSLPGGADAFTAGVCENMDDMADAVRSYIADAAERIDAALDKHSNAVQFEPIHVERSATPGAEKRYELATKKRKQRDERPQDLFDPPVDNSNTPFEPRLGHLASIPGLEQSHSKLDRHALQLKSRKSGTTRQARYWHPFRKLLKSLPGRYQEWQLQAPTPQPPAPVEDTPFLFVDSPATLADMLKHLGSAREIALDLEHHSHRSFQGFSCLLQVSTRSRDFIVDVLALRSRLGAALAPILADPSVLKVLHGADSDVLWLQKDFGLFVVNLFDTGQAARVLNMPAGYASLLSHFCGVTTDKRYQLSDWRTRPLSAAMLRYAQTDTHYLLYIADCFRVKLAEAAEGSTGLEAVPPSLQVPLPVTGPQGPLGIVLERSRQLCLLLYEKPLFNDTDYIAFYSKCGVQLNQQQLAAFSALFAWRDGKARELDESVGYVLPKRLLLVLAQNMPGSRTALIGLASKNFSGSGSVAVTYAQDIVDVIKRAREQVATAVPGLDDALSLQPRAQPGALQDEDPEPCARAPPGDNTPSSSSTSPSDADEDLAVSDASPSTARDASDSLSRKPPASPTLRGDAGGGQQRPASTHPQHGEGGDAHEWGEKQAASSSPRVRGSDSAAQREQRGDALSAARESAEASAADMGEAARDEDGEGTEMFDLGGLKVRSISVGGLPEIAPRIVGAQLSAGASMASAFGGGRLSRGPQRAPPPAGAAAAMFGAVAQRAAQLDAAGKAGVSLASVFGTKPANDSAQAAARLGPARQLVDRVAASFKLPVASAALGGEEAGEAAASAEDDVIVVQPGDAAQQVRDAVNALRAENAANEADAGVEEEEEEGELPQSLSGKRLRSMRDDGDDDEDVFGEYTAVRFRGTGGRIGAGDRGKGHKRHQREGTAGEPLNFKSFDYDDEISRTEGAGPQRGRGMRGGRGGIQRGRGRGRLQGRGPEKGRFEGRKDGIFNPYAVNPDHLLAGGKRASTAPRSGNKSASFKRR